MFPPVHCLSRHKETGIYFSILEKALSPQVSLAVVYTAPKTVHTHRDVPGQGPAARRCLQGRAEHTAGGMGAVSTDREET